MPTAATRSVAVTSLVFALGAAAPRAVDAQPRTTPLPPVVSLPTDVLATLVPQGADVAPEQLFVIALGPGMPPRGARVVHVENERRISGSEAPSFTPARNLDLVVDPRSPAPIRGALLVCPSARLVAHRRLFIRDHLGDRRWRAAVAFSSSAAIGASRPCADAPNFVAASLAAVLPGRQRITRLDLAAVFEPGERERIARELPAPWGGTSDVHAYRTPRLRGQLVRVYREGRWQLVYVTARGAELVTDDASGLVEVAADGNGAVVPFALCVDGRAAVLGALCAAGATRCEVALRWIGRCVEP